MRQFRNLLSWSFLLLLSVSAAMAAEKPKYIFLFIGDGMSIPQRMMSEEFSRCVNDGAGLTLNSFPYQVMTTTRSADSFITDSAAGGTAIACGEKTENGTIGMDAAKSRNLVSSAEAARDAGKKVGIITSVTINHATPASFYGHNPSRGNGYELGLDLIKSNFDFFGGGGVDGHADKKSEQFKGDIYDLAKEAGYTVVHDTAELEKLQPGCGKVLAVQEDGALPYAIDDQDGYRIKDYLKKAIQLLDGDEGFFIMVEGGKIDWMCHANDAGTTMREVLDLDKAVQVADDFAKQHADETLIIVTGDHETGGLTLGFAGTGYNSYVERLKFQTCSRDAFGGRLSAAQNEKGDAYSFEDAKKVITESFGLKFDGNGDDPMKLSEEQANEIEKAFADGKNNSELTTTVISIFDHKCGLAWTSGSHTALPVNTSASGVGSEKFRGLIDNTDISKLIKEFL